MIYLRIALRPSIQPNNTHELYIINPSRLFKGKIIPPVTPAPSDDNIQTLIDEAEEKWGAVDVVHNAAFDTSDTFLPQQVLHVGGGIRM